MSNITIKKLICGLLCACTLSLYACNGTQGTTESGESLDTSESNADNSKDASAWIEEINDAGGKYRGKTAKIVSCAESYFYDDSETPIAKAVMSRNGLVEQRLGISISCEELTADTLEKELRAALKAGKPYADIICAPATVLAKLAAEGLLENLYSLPYMDYEKGYISDSALNSQTAQNTMYMFSDLVTMDIGGTVGMFYNKKLLESVGVDPFKQAYSGNWTWTDLANIAAAVSGDEVYAIDSLLSDEELATAVYTACGGAILRTGADGVTSAYDDSLASTAASYIQGLFGNSTYCAGFGEEDLVKTFNDGNIAFVVAKLDNVALFDGAESEWGLVPLPKLDAAQVGYRSMVSGSTMAIAVPKSSADSGFSGAVLNAMLAASGGDLESALKQTYINYHFWSNNAALMLDRIAQSRCVDLGVYYSSLPAVADVGINALTAEQIGPLPAEKLSAFAELADKLFN